MGKATIIKLTELPKTHLVDMTGMVSGRLKILSISHKRIFPKGSQVYFWNALCDCGNVVTINGQHFLKGSIQSCGCLNKEASSRKFKENSVTRDETLPPVQHFSSRTAYGKGFPIPDWVDKRFGRLTVTDFMGLDLYHIHHVTSKGKETTTRKIITKWVCRCHCGCEVIRNSNYLRTHKDSGTCVKCQRKKSRNQVHKPETLSEW